MSGCIPEAKLTAATSLSQRDAIVNQVGNRIDVVTEPERRDTFAAIVLASAYLAGEKGCCTDEVIVVMPCDPYTEKGYYETISLMAKAVEEQRADLVLMGVKPENASGELGYILAEDDGSSKAGDVLKVKQFVEKPSPAKAEEMIRLISSVKADGDTVGGTVTCVIKGCPAGVGEPEFDKLHAALGYAMLGINAVKGVEFGEGFAMAAMRGSQANDIFVNDNGRVSTLTNRSGGIQGGISNGQDIYFRVAFKPVATLLKEQPTIDSRHNETTLKARGRHDPCVVPRAVPIVEAMAAMTILDEYLIGKTIKM